MNKKIPQEIIATKFDDFPLLTRTMYVQFSK